MKELTLEITSRCYQNCSWCSSSAHPEGVHTSYGSVLGILDKYKGECNVVRFSGGEPTLHPDLPVFLSHAKSLGYKTVLMTNGKHIRGDLFRDIHSTVDEYWINIVDKHSIIEAIVLRQLKSNVFMHVVLVKGNEEWVRRGIDTGLLYNVPVRLLILQKQGRGTNCEPLESISWTGDKGCNKEGKITITHEGKVTTCSALKYGKCSLKEE